MKKIPYLSICLLAVILGSYFFKQYRSSESAALSLSAGQTDQKRVLMFVAYNDVWWSEYKVLYESLRAQGYQVDVRSSGTGEAWVYGNAIDATPDAGGGYPTAVSYGAFVSYYDSTSGGTWNAAWNTPQPIPLNGRIQDVPNLNLYDALVIPGGHGTIGYRYDGSYSDSAPQANPALHISPAADVQAAAEKLNQLINEALLSGKPVAAECHGAPMVGYARVMGTAGQGADGLGVSVLDGGYATGFPNTTTTDAYTDLGITYLGQEKLVIDGPEDEVYLGNGRDMILTTTDWYPETVLYLANTLHTMLRTHPTPAQRKQTINVLVYGGDEPAHYLPQQPARYSDFVDLLNDGGDGLNISAVGTTNAQDLSLVNLQNYDVLFFFGHDHLTTQIQADIKSYADQGGGIVGAHHAIYNDGYGKGDIIDLFGASVPPTAWPAQVIYGPANPMINVNLGHFVSTHGVHLLPTQLVTTTQQYSSTMTFPNLNLDNDGSRGYYSFEIPAADEVYTGLVFNPATSFGHDTNEIDRLFSSDYGSGSHDIQGWVRLFDDDGDGTAGRVVYLQPGETADRTLSHPAYRQVLKNGVIWAAANPDEAAHSIALPIVYSGGEAQLDWHDGLTGCLYDLYRGDVPYRAYGVWQEDLASSVAVDSEADTSNRFYYVHASHCAGDETAVSAEMGLFHFMLTPGAS